MQVNDSIAITCQIGFGCLWQYKTHEYQRLCGSRHSDSGRAFEPVASPAGSGALAAPAPVLIRPRPSLAGTVVEATLGPRLSLERRYLIHWHGSSGMPPMHQNPDKSLV